MTEQEGRVQAIARTYANERAERWRQRCEEARAELAALKAQEDK